MSRQTEATRGNRCATGSPPGFHEDITARAARITVTGDPLTELALLRHRLVNRLYVLVRLGCRRAPGRGRMGSVRFGGGRFGSGFDRMFVRRLFLRLCGDMLRRL